MKGSFKTALIAAVVSAVVAAGAAVATTQTFVLGTTNSPDAATAVVAQNKDGLGGLNAPVLKLTNLSTGASAAPLALTAGAGRPPLVVNSMTRVAKLNADRLDGIDSGEFLKSSAPAPGQRVGEAWHEVTSFNWCRGGSDLCSGVWAYWGAPYNSPGYYKDPLGIVHLKGLVKATEDIPGFHDCEFVSFFQLPVGYRPAATEIAVSLHDNAVTRIDVQATGWVTLCKASTFAVDSGEWYLLDGISFRAAG